MPIQVSALYRYPLKSGMPEALQVAELDALGVVDDRRWMLVESGGRFLTQRVLPTMGHIRAHAEGCGLHLEIDGYGSWQLGIQDLGVERPVQIWRDTVQARDAGEDVARWLSDYLGRHCRLVKVSPQGRPVDPRYASRERIGFADGFPLLLINEASVEDLAQRSQRVLDPRRFRPNLVISGCEPYAEDHWRLLQIGDVRLRVVKPCSRCIIPTLDPISFERDPEREPLATLEGYRKRDGEVYFGQNLLADPQGSLVLGSIVEVLETQESSW